MKNDLTCPVVRDLLPLYVDGLAAPETAQAVDRHLAECAACAALRRDLEKPLNGEQPEEIDKEVDYLKQVKRKNRLRIVLSVFCVAAAIFLGLAAKIFLIGTPLQPQSCTVALSTITEENSLVLVVDSAESAAALYDWKTEENDGVVTITARRVLVSPFYNFSAVRLEIPLDGVKEIWLGGLSGDLLYQDGMLIDGVSQEIYSAKVFYTGDASSLGNLARALDFENNISPHYTHELKTSEHPYRWTIQFESVPYRQAVCRQMTAYYGPLMLALVENLEEAGWSYTDREGVLHDHVITLDEVNARLPGLIERYNQENGTDWPVRENIKDYADSLADIARLRLILFHEFAWIDVPCEN